LWHLSDQPDRSATSVDRGRPEWMAHGKNDVIDPDRTCPICLTNEFEPMRSLGRVNPLSCLAELNAGSGNN
jgi:hypothetical protein